MKKLTIITINFNHKEGLKRTIDSIVSQTFTDYEWIVVDGGSIDGSKELLEQYKDKFVWWCSEPDKGVYNAMNKGIAHARGEYTNFMNSGDIFVHPNILEEIFSKPHTADILYGMMMRGSIDGEVSERNIMKPNIKWWELCNNTFGHQSEFMKTELFSIKMYDESYKVAADADWNTYMVVNKRVSTEYIPLKISIIEEGGISTNMETLCKERKRIRETYYYMLSNEDISDLKYLAVVNHFKVSRQIFYLLSRCMNRIRKRLNIIV